MIAGCSSRVHAGARAFWCRRSRALLLAQLTAGNGRYSGLWARTTTFLQSLAFCGFSARAIVLEHWLLAEIALRVHPVLVSGARLVELLRRPLQVPVRHDRSREVVEGQRFADDRMRCSSSAAAPARSSPHWPASSLTSYACRRPMMAAAAPVVVLPAPLQQRTFAEIPVFELQGCARLAFAWQVVRAAAAAAVCW